MLPTLSEFGINAPVYIREIRSRTRWYPEGCNNPRERAQAVASSLFDSTSHVYSVWLVSTEQELYGVVAARTNRRNPREQDIDFIWFTDRDLQAVGLIAQNQPEEDCLHVRHLHFNVQIEPHIAEKFCESLILQGREAKRLSRKKHTIPILVHQKDLGCKASGTTLEKCECEKW